MPGSKFMGIALKLDVMNGKVVNSLSHDGSDYPLFFRDSFDVEPDPLLPVPQVTNATIDNSMLNILTPMFAIGIFDNNNTNVLSKYAIIVCERRPRFLCIAMLQPPLCFL